VLDELLVVSLRAHPPSSTGRAALSVSVLRAESLGQIRSLFPRLPTAFSCI
jgi:hypothetical protein